MHPDVTTPGRTDPADASSRGTFDLSWLITLRWCAVAGQLATIAIVTSLFGVSVMMTPLLLIVGIEAASNFAIATWVRKDPTVPDGLIAGVMAFDVLILTGLLYFSGGPSNPFNSLYIVHIALAAVVLRAGWTWALVALSLACSGLLFVSHVWLETDPSRYAGIMQHHLEGMWVAFFVSAAFIVYFVTRVGRELGEREGELAELRVVTAEREKLAALATLAAGAAHELATPLSTIAIAAKEMQRSLEKKLGEDGAVEDARLIRDQVERCRTILDQMSADAGQTSGETLIAVRVGEIINASLAGVPASERVRVDIPHSITNQQLHVYPRALGQALRVLLKNAIEASPGEREVVVRAGVEADTVRIEVADEGEGMSADVLARAGQPFFTTKPPGKGMGLGLFLARTVVERLGGSLSISSTPGKGTRAAVTIPA